MKCLLSLLSLMFLMISCGKNQIQENKTKTIAYKLPELTEQQQQEGWKWLFNGNSFEGWRFFKNNTNNSWEISEGTLHCKPFEDADKRGDLITEKQYKDFELRFEWKLSPQGNSGVMYHVTEDHEEPYLTGPEYQLLDDLNYPGDKMEEHLSSGLFGMYGPSKHSVKPIGQWNTSRLLVRGNHVEHWLNDRKTLVYTIHSPDWIEKKKHSKWKDEVDFGAFKKGHIDLQDHHTEVWFRNIMLRDL